MIKICVMGLGYVGLPVALGISSKFKTLYKDGFVGISFEIPQILAPIFSNQKVSQEPLKPV